MKTQMRIGYCLIAGMLLAGEAFAAARFDPSTMPFGTVPPLTLSSYNASANNAREFQSWFENQYWSGDVVARNLTTTGLTVAGPAAWSARAQLDAMIKASGQASRRIVTSGGTGSGGQPFLLGSLSTLLQSLLTSLLGSSTTLVDFLRGDTSLEKQFIIDNPDGTSTVQSGNASGIFRARASAMGDVIHSRVIYVGAPPANYLFDGYSSFKATNSARPGRVYFGANDGMVHGVDATTGDEVFAYVPSMLMANMNKLSVDPYVHTYFVDGGMAVGDVNFTPGSANWHTVLIGGLGAGGAGLYALDVTDAGAGSIAAAQAKIRWEIVAGAAGFTDLGEVYGDPVITRVNNGSTSGRWVAVVGNGYNNNGTTGHAVLYVIDIETGALIRALDTGSGTVASPNGLSTPALVDMDSDGISDLAYAGDIDGNLWKFDLRDPDPANWTVATTPLFSTGQPIVGAPDVAPHPTTGVIVYFATGKMFTPADAADAAVQNYAYGIWDGAPAGNTAILDQTVTEALYGGVVRVRTTSGLPINWSTPGKALHRGWRTALPPGERVLGSGFVRGGRYHFVSVNPTIVNTPKPDGANWLMELDYLTGGVSGEIIFDLNGDGLLNDVDRVASSGGGVMAGNSGIPAGVYIGAGLVSQPVLAAVNTSQQVTLFNTNPYLSPGDFPTNPPPVAGDRGVIGGHFDVEIWYPQGTPCQYVFPGASCYYVHTHEYDDKFDVTGIDMTNASDPRYNLANAMTNGTRFKLLMGGQENSPAVSIKVGTRAYVPVYNYQTDGLLDLDNNYNPFTAGPSLGSLKFNMPTDAFVAKDWAATGGAPRVGLQPTTWPCVQNNTPGPASSDPWLSGALYVQLVDATTAQADIEFNVANNPKMGWRLKTTSMQHLLASYSIFWHTDACYLAGNWSASSPPPYSGGFNTRPAVPAPGSQDPPYDSGTPMPTSVSQNRSSLANGGYTVITTTIYANGSKLIVTQTYSAKGQLLSTTQKTVGTTPGNGGAGNGGAGGGGRRGNPQGGALTSTVHTGYAESRNAGKISRVNWHEIFRD